MGPSPLERPGYHLVFHDEFDRFDPAVWDRSAPGNDALPAHDPRLCDMLKNTPNEPENVLSSVDGRLRLQVRPGSKCCSCTHSGAEIKTFNNFSWTDPSVPFRMWKVLPGSYVEVRLRLPDCTGVGAAFWLYGGNGDPRAFAEADIFELYPERRDAFMANFHSGRSYETAHRERATRIEVRDLDGNPVHLPAQELTFGVAWDERQMTMSLNGVPYKTLSFNGRTLPERFNRLVSAARYRKAYPFNIRLNAGGALGPPDAISNCMEWPQYLSVDYVRVYLRDDRRAMPDTDTLYLQGDYPGDNLRLPYHPGTEYRWETHPHLRLEPNPTGLNTCDCAQWWVTPTPEAPPGRYRLHGAVLFPGGYREAVEVEVEYSRSSLRSE